MGRLLRSFDFYLFFLYLTGFYVPMVTSIRDERAVSFTVGYILGVYLLCTDALPEKVRIGTLHFGVPLFAMSVLILCISLYTSSVKDLNEWTMDFRGTR